MDQVVRDTLLEIIDLLYSQHSSVKCGYQWCRGVLVGGEGVACEHMSICRYNYGVTERLLELKERVQQHPVEVPV